MTKTRVTTTAKRLENQRTQKELQFHAVCDLSQKRWEGRVCNYIHERTIHSVLPQGRTVLKGGTNPPNHHHPQITPWFNDRNDKSCKQIQTWMDRIKCARNSSQKTWGLRIKVLELATFQEVL